MCNNFNYETRMKCNRRGLAKTPKRNVNKSTKYSSNPKGNLVNNQMNNQMQMQMNNQVPMNNQVQMNNQTQLPNNFFNQTPQQQQSNSNNISPSNPNLDSYVQQIQNIQNLQGINPNMQLNYQLSGENPDQLILSQEEEEEMKKNKKPFAERVGDWVCIKCKNLNFSFRVICNRCQLPKMESDKMFQYMGNLMNYVKLNEMMQQQILTQGTVGPTQGKSFINNNSININNNFYTAPGQTAGKNAKTSNKFNPTENNVDENNYYEQQWWWCNNRDLYIKQ